MREDYEKALKKGERACQKAVVQGRYPFLPALDDILRDAGNLSEYPVGLMEISLDRVTGTKTKGRQEAFADNFMPLLEFDSEFGSKWANLYDAQMEEGIRDPVKVYEYLWNFYVAEGNKRVSVLKYLDVPVIMADITRVLPQNHDDPQVQIYDEFIEFFNAVPLYDFVFSQKGSYKKLAELAGRDLNTPWPQEAVKELQADFVTFETAFLEKGGAGLDISPSDAFLLYLGIYDLDSLKEETPKTCGEKIDRIWDEFLVEASEDNIAFVEDPDLRKKEGIPILTPLLKRPLYTKNRPLRLTFIYDKDPKNSRWIYGHELGRNQVTDAFDGLVVTRAVSSCDTEEKFMKAVAENAADSDVIFTPSSAQMDMTLKAAVEYPDIKFLNCSINLSHNAVRTYYGRMYEAKFLMGALAGSISENHAVGYVADYPIYGTIANINAFAIGAAMTDPECKIHLTWTSVENSDWRREMWEKNIRVSSGPDLIKPTEETREYGLYRKDDFGNVYNIAMPIWNWGKYYELIVQTILNDTWPDKHPVRGDQALNYWWGMSAGVIDVILSEHLSYYSGKLVEGIRRSMLNGVIHPFAGRMVAQDGTVMRSGHEEGRMTNEEIVSMAWLNDNVIGSLPEKWSLKETARKTVKISGVIDA